MSFKRGDKVKMEIPGRSTIRGIVIGLSNKYYASHQEPIYSIRIAEGPAITDCSIDWLKLDLDPNDLLKEIL